MRSVEELYRAYGKRVFNAAWRITGDRAAAEDILHEAFVKVIQHGHTFRGESSIYSWLFAITKNLALRSRSRTFRGFEKLIEAADSSPLPPFHDGLERRYYIQQVKEGCLVGLLRCLPFHQRVAFIFHVLYGLPTRTVAGILGRTDNSVRILVSRAKAGLKAFLCANCSLYDAANRCRCENMVRFSRQNEWIDEYRPTASPAAIERELKDLKSEVRVYQTLIERDPPAHLLPDLLGRRDLLLLSRRKLK